jgi:tellurite resistance protein TehA-like permease
MHPASFAMVMATGIVSVAAQLQGATWLARPLVWLNVLMYAVLWTLTILRVLRYWPRGRADLADHNRTVGFFTITAGTCVLGNQFIVVMNQPRIAAWLWAVGIALWAVTTYLVFTILTVKSNKPSLADGINGGWLVAVVAAQAVSALGGLVAPHLGEAEQVALFLALTLWLGGGMLYIWIIALIFYRYTFFPLDPKQLAPPYWINMGAMAISTLAGTVLISGAGHSPLLAEVAPFLKGLTLLFWATATWWIPLLLALGVWRHVLRRVPMNYDVVYWSAVFPLGMYAACTRRLIDALDLPFLEFIPQLVVYVAAAAWAVTMVGLLRRLPALARASGFMA